MSPEVLKKIGWISEARFEPFRKECRDQPDVDAAAWMLYEWNALMASALSEVIHHVEVLVRNALIEQLRTVHPLEYPWGFEQPELYKVTKKIANARQGKVRADDVISRLNLGFWTNLLEDSPSQNEELWRQTLRKAFPRYSGGRKEVQQTLKAMNLLRNRCAHQDSLLSIDPTVELKKLLRLASWIDEDARTWLEGLERVSQLERPIPSNSDTVLISVSKEAIQLYEEHGVFLLGVNRSIAAKEYIGFYFHKDNDGKSPVIYRYFPRILESVLPIDWSMKKAKELKSSHDLEQKRLGKIMSRAIDLGFEDLEGYNVYFLSEIPSQKNRKSNTSSCRQTLEANRKSDIPHNAAGRGSAFVKRPRYFPKSSLIAAMSTDDL